MKKKHPCILLFFFVFLLISIGAVFGFANQSDAVASLTYSSAANISLSSSAITLIIATGSVADNLVVNATSVAITLSSSTGGAFTLTSPQAFSSSTAGSGGSLSQTCSSGIETDTITQTSGSETYTLTPSGSACTANSGVTTNNGGGGGVVYVAAGGGVSGNYGITPTPSSTASSIPSASSTVSIATSTSPFTPTSLSTMSPSELETLLAQLESELQALESQAQGDTATQTAGTTTSPAAPSSSCTSTPITSGIAFQDAGYPFTRNISYGDQGSDVAALQGFLINQNTGPAARRLALAGKTGFFANRTFAALKEFQASVCITATGYFGEITRAYMNASAEGSSMTNQS